MEKNRQILLDILIGISIVAVIVLIDHLIINWKSQPADEDWSLLAKNQENVATEIEMQPITDRAFIPILNFHHISIAPAKASAVTKSFYIEPQKFEAIIKSLADDGYQSVFVSDAVNYLQQKQMPKNKIMALTFDDGNEDFYINAFPILQKYQVKSSMYIMTGVRGKDWLTADQILELRDTGLVEFGSHTVWHPKLTKISEAEQRRELKDSRDYLENLLGRKMEIICYPFGLYNDQVKKIAKETGYLAGLTFDREAWQNPDDLMALKRISVYPSLDVIKFLDKLKLQNNKN